MTLVKIMKKLQNIYDKSMAEDQSTVDFFEAFNAFSKNKKSESYPFYIKYIHSNSEYLYNYNIPRYTECFFVKDTLFVISNHLQHQLSVLADSARFLVDGIIKIKDLDNIYNYLKKNNHEVLSYFRLKNVDMTLKENQHYIAKYYLFLKKIDYDQDESSFFKMMLKSRRILSKIHNNGEVEKDIEYLLNKNF
jgi:hypothetical protein